MHHELPVGVWIFGKDLDILAFFKPTEKRLGCFVHRECSAIQRIVREDGLGIWLTERGVQLGKR